MESGAAPRGYDRTPVLVGAAIAVLITLVATIDFRGVVDDIPPVPPTCVPATDQECNDARFVDLQARLSRADELEDDYAPRMWLYGLGALAAVLAGAGVAFARAGPGSRRDLFTDLGIGGVIWMLAGLGLIIGADSELLDPPAGPIFYPGIALLAIAGAGTLLTRRGEPGAATSREPPRGGVAVRVIGFGCTAIAAVAAAIVFTDGTDTCAGSLPDWANTLMTISWIAAGLGVLAGIASLIQRRWMAALVMLAVGPFCALFAALSTVCWN